MARAKPATLPTSRRKSTASAARKRTTKKWSARVTKSSDAMTLHDNVFTRSPAAIAKALKNAAERSRRRKSTPFRSAMSMLNFFINRAGNNLSAARYKKLESAKDELRKAFGKTNKM